MEYADILKTLKKWEEDYPDNSLYQTTVNDRKCWDNLNRLTNNRCKEVIMKFLNTWNCRISKRRTSILTDRCKKMHVYFLALKKENLLKLDINKKVQIHGKQIEMYTVIRKIFETFSEIKNVKGTAISKIMHCVNPALFVMWDEQIAKNYGFSQTAEGYINFLIRMQREAKRLEKRYNADKYKLRMPLTRLLDIYNWENKDKWDVRDTWA